MDYRSELNDIILFARGDQTMRALLRHEGKVAIPELDRFKSAIKTGGPQFTQTPQNYYDRFHIAQQLRGYRKQGLIKTNQAEYRANRAGIRKPIEHEQFTEKVNRRLTSANPGAIGSQFSGGYTGQQGQIDSYETPRLNGAMGEEHWKGSVFAKKDPKQQPAWT